MARKKKLIQVEEGLWFRFRGAAFTRGVTVSDLLERVLSLYLEDTDVEPAPVREAAIKKVAEAEDKPTKKKPGKDSRFRG